MRRLPLEPRTDWQQTAQHFGFRFHTMYGEPYWDESACYAFTLAQIERDLEDPSAELHAMCLDMVDTIVREEALLRRLAIPEFAWGWLRDSWLRGERSLYGRFDFAYDGHGPAKLYEYNADTPTALYETAFFQWVWLEQALERGLIPADCDQFNSVQETLIGRFGELGIDATLFLACARGSEEDRGTVDYLRDCAMQAGLHTDFLHIEDIGIDTQGQFTGLHGEPLRWLFKLYPWEFMLREPYAPRLPGSDTYFIEPPWKALLSNKGLLPLLWERHPQHPNLLPAYFADDPRCGRLGMNFVRKPLFSREGANVRVVRHGQILHDAPGPYGEEGYVLQALRMPPVFDGRHVVVGSWIVGDTACGIGLREDAGVVTQDLSRFVPHVILD